ncbi:MAG: DUF2237 family protein [Balneolaceae bacterium]
MNIFGNTLISCSESPLTGFYRDGCCNTGSQDAGVHTVCAKMTDEFLAFSKAAGNDLSTPRPEFNFPGLKAGDYWCLCALRWLEAYRAGKAPLVMLEACHERSLDMIDMDLLISHSDR